jgi:hypothetical protein
VRSNIDPVLKLVDGVVEAAGPLEWEDGEANAIVAVTISQDRMAGVSSSPPSFDPSHSAWRLTVPPAVPHKKFKKGPARAIAQILATGDGISTYVYPCDKEVELEE